MPHRGGPGKPQTVSRRNERLGSLPKVTTMNQFARAKRPKSQDITCADLVTLAEQEFAAFFGAVTKLFGSDHARVSAEDWLHELLAVNVLPASAREWRLLTVKVVTRLARRVKATDEAVSQLRSATPS